MASTGLATPFVRRAATRIVLVALAGYVGYRAAALVVSGHVDALLLKDYTLYITATEGWLADGRFYPAWQTGGPWQLEWGAILYPPVALLLFVPFTVIDPTVSAALWLTVPLAITAMVIASWRPTAVGWTVILALLSIHPLSFLDWVAGTPTTWFVALIALASRWPWLSSAMIVKPTLAPFALIGLTDRRWWMVASILAAVSLALGPLTLQWLEMLVQVRGSDATVFYSLANVPMLFVPIAARIWTGRAVTR